jgi:deazaflavin-dependent oxidoreductase (nitroreductase family)
VSVDNIFGAEHVAKYVETDGETGFIWRGVQTLILTTVGRTTGEKHSTPLIFGRDGDDVVIVASKGGAPEHPGWYRNLVKTPEVGVQIRGDRFQATARTAEGDERERLWATMAEIWPAYDEYKTKTDREIPVVVLARL